MGSAIIVFREVLEAALIIGIVMAATRGVAGRARWVGAGIGGGLTLAALVAVFAGAIANAAEGMGQELFNAGVLFAAVLMLGWHNIWMSQHAKELTQHMNNVGSSVAGGTLPMRALTAVVGLAVLREGSEVVLFLYGIAAASGGPSQMLIGSLAGLAAGTLVGAALYFGLLRIPTKHLFKVISWMILFLAAGMASEGARFLVQADYLPSLGGPLWDTSFILSDHSYLGQALHILVGYTPRPLGIQLVFYGLTILTIGTLMTITSKTKLETATAAVAFILAALTASTLSSNPASAGEHIYSPIVHGGEIEFETKGMYVFDDDPAKDGALKEIHEVGYAFTDWWKTALYVRMEKSPGGSLEDKYVGWENIFQLTEQGEYPIDVGLYLEYKKATQSGGHDKVEAKLLLEKETGDFLHTANIIFEKEVTGADKDGVELEYGLRSKYRYRKELEFGIEAFGGFGEISDFKPKSEQKHFVGPVLSGKLSVRPKWYVKYEAGYLFGVSDAAQDGKVKWLLELETYF